MNIKLSNQKSVGMNHFQVWGQFCGAGNCFQVFRAHLFLPPLIIWKLFTFRNRDSFSKCSNIFNSFILTIRLPHVEIIYFTKQKLLMFKNCIYFTIVIYFVRRWTFFNTFHNWKKLCGCQNKESFLNRLWWYICRGNLSKLQNWTSIL